MPQVPNLNVLSIRPTLLKDGQFGRRVVDNKPVEPLENDPTQYQGSIGFPGPWGRERVTDGLPLNGMGQGPVCLEPATVLCDFRGYVVDPDGNLVGEQNAIWVHRFLGARWTQDTRRLAG